MANLIPALSLLMVCHLSTAQPYGRPGNVGDYPEGGITVAGYNADVTVTLSRDHFFRLFQPLASAGYTYKSSRIIENGNVTYLVANYQMPGSPQEHIIGIQLHPEGNRLSIGRAPIVVKCSKSNIDCER